MLIRVLRSHGHTCEEAEDGLEAVDTLRDAAPGRFHVILMDFVMPRLGTRHRAAPPCDGSGHSQPRRLPSPPHSLSPTLPITAITTTDGPGATRQIRANGYGGRIFGVTGNAMPSDVAFFVAAGADEVRLFALSTSSSSFFPVKVAG